MSRLVVGLLGCAGGTNNHGNSYLRNDDDVDENNENNYGDDHDNDIDENDDDDVDENGRTDNHGTSYSSLLLLAAQPFLPASLVQGREPKLFIMGEFSILKKTQNSF